MASPSISNDRTKVEHATASRSPARTAFAYGESR
jgi:hypothetical protein